MSTPPVVPPMSPALRERLYGVWGWIGAVLWVVGLLIAGVSVTAESLGMDASIPKPVLLGYGVAIYVIQGIGTWLNFVAKANVTPSIEPDEADLGWSDPEVG